MWCLFYYFHADPYLADSLPAPEHERLLLSQPTVFLVQISIAVYINHIINGESIYNF